MAKLSLSSFISKNEKTSAFYKKKADQNYAAAKNNPDEGYKYQTAKEQYEKAKYYKEKAEKAKKAGRY